MIGIEIVSRIDPDKRFEFLQAFDLLAHQEDREASCVLRALFEEVKDPNRFLWVEHWTSVEELEGYLQTQHFRSLVGAICVLGSMVEVRMIEFISIPNIQDIPDALQWAMDSLSGG
jgi:quinol monooxygenase YgiN